MREVRASTRWWVVALVGIVGSLGLVACSDSASDAGRDEEAPASEPTGPQGSSLDGRIVFVRGHPEDGEAVTYTVNPDGSDEEQLFFGGHSEAPSWSPDGTEIQVFCCDDGMVAHFVDPKTGDLRTLPPPDVDVDVELFCGWAWSPDADRIACEGYGVDDPRLTGIYTIRASDGGGMQRVTSTAHGYDTPGDYSPDGRRLVFARVNEEDGTVRLFVTAVDGSGLQRVSPPDLQVEPAGAWSPDGSTILFETSASKLHSEIWVANADGSSPHELPITPACGGPFSDPTSFGCFDPAWSPDGSKIVFARSNADGGADLYIVNMDGTGLVQVTDGSFDHQPDWGMPATGA